MLNAQIPLPSFEDIRKLLQFWIDQQDKWFYFETLRIRIGSEGASEVPKLRSIQSIPSWTANKETDHYLQTRLIGRIHDVVSYPPSLLLSDVSIVTASLSYGQIPSGEIVSNEKRDRYGLVFSQITYYEPINDIDSFLEQDQRMASSD